MHHANPSGAIGALILLCLYFLPAIVAMARRHHQQSAILLLNLLLGWTLIGWVVAIVWAATAVNPPVATSDNPVATAQPKHVGVREARQILGSASIPPPFPMQRTKVCPRCAEDVKAAAQVCRFCGHEFV
jgi:hypothetical protein